MTQPHLAAPLSRSFGLSSLISRLRSRRASVAITTLLLALLLLFVTFPVAYNLTVYYPSLLLPPRDEPGAYTFHERHDGVLSGLRIPQDYVPMHCPSFVTPSNIHFLVINMDRSRDRLARMTTAFVNLGLPMFERIRGVDVARDENQDFDIPRQEFADGSFGCALGHRAAWKSIVANDAHEWFVVLEDDTPPISKEAITEFPPIPEVCDSLMFSSVSKLEHVCFNSTVKWAISGHGAWAYLLHKRSAHKLLDMTRTGFDNFLPDLFAFHFIHTCWHRPYEEIVERHNFHDSVRKNLNMNKTFS